MKLSIFILLLLPLFPFQAFGQKKERFREIIKTDSSKIEIIRNAVFRCYEETYKNKDSIWTNVTYTDDTSRLNTQGWKTKSGKHLGVWKEYNRSGELIYTWDYDIGVCIVNKSLYPYHDLLEKMKLVADSLIISAYGIDFFETHVRFEFDCSAFDSDGYVGSWTDPFIKKPTEFRFRYSVKLPSSDWYPQMIGINLDALGNYMPTIDDRWNRYGFEDLKGNKATFNIDIYKAKEIAKSNGLQVSDKSEIFEFLTWENLRNQAFYNGQFRYYIIERTSKTKYTKKKGRKGIVFRYNVYSFSPWTGAFVEKKKMLSIHEWDKNSGLNTGLMPYNE